MHRSHAKMRLKNPPPKLNSGMAKAASKGYTLDIAANALVGSRIVTQSKTVLFSIKPLYVKLTTIFLT